MRIKQETAHNNNSNNNLNQSTPSQQTFKQAGKIQFRLQIKKEMTIHQHGL